MIYHYNINTLIELYNRVIVFIVKVSHDRFYRIIDIVVYNVSYGKINFDEDPLRIKYAFIPDLNEVCDIYL